MTAVLLSPHQDDAVLFAAFTCYEVRPHVVVVLESHLQEQRGRGITNAMRAREDECAFGILGVTHEQWTFRDDAPDWRGILDCVIRLQEHYDYAYAPAIEDGGHDHHNEIGRIADEVYGARATHYMTYRRGHGFSEGSRPIVPAPGALAAKLHALSCYTSQIAEESTGHWFFGPFREWHE